MEIEKVIKLFEKCITHYKKAVDEKYTISKVFSKKMDNGLCYFALYVLDIDVDDIFYHHYKNFLSYGWYMFPIVHPNSENHLNESILPRLNFLKTEVVRLKKLQRKGYTHI